MAQTLKEKIITKIESIDNEELLNEVYQLLELNSENVNTYILTEEQLNVAQEAQEQIKKGHFSTHEEVQKKINKWLEK
jgi:uncharacterized protein YlaI